MHFRHTGTKYIEYFFMASLNFVLLNLPVRNSFTVSSITRLSSAARDVSCTKYNLSIHYTHTKAYIGTEVTGKMTTRKGALKTRACEILKAVGIVPGHRKELYQVSTVRHESREDVFTFPAGQVKFEAPICEVGSHLRENDRIAPLKKTSRRQSCLTPQRRRKVCF
jgi:hypothetical protein